VRKSRFAEIGKSAAGKRTGAGISSKLIETRPQGRPGTPSGRPAAPTITGD
jgi:hypothetical protein